ncbi:class 3 adenylate cyclase [Kribbella aluminosa]|uniref:Class 3 adenylate cyclase n=1 Tax=Kribbella aluminosa TaxID=416017 RepID=A0ABS4UJ15_9ACTN|nr:adenylate/guanylate cyclase domain-containing protein [Kribbella aluminosa]MBP2351646.1 class 3 adenylate cyclase [Kribbella aluminosa]
MADPINRTILVTDVERFSSRVDGDQAVLRRVLYEVLRKTFAAASIYPTEYTTEDRGDGVFALIDAKVPKAQLLRALITVTPAELREYNRRASEVARVRMRCVVHSGEVALDERGAIGAAVIDAFRICDSDDLKDELAKIAEPSLLCVTDLLYQSLVRHQHPGLVPEHFHPLDASSKDGHRDGWIYDRSRIHQESAASPEQPKPRAAPSGGRCARGGNLLPGYDARRR